MGPSFSNDLSRRVGKKKTLSLGQEGEWGLIQASKRGFRGVFCSLCLGWIFWCVEILLQKVTSLNMLGVRQRCAKSDDERQNFSERRTRKAVRATFDVLCVRFLFERV